MPIFKLTEAELVADQLQGSGYSYFLIEETLLANDPEDIRAYARGLRMRGIANGFGSYVLYAEEITDSKTKKGITINFYSDLPDVAKDIYDLSVIHSG